MRTCVYNLQFEQKCKLNKSNDPKHTAEVVNKYSRLIDQVQKNFFCPRPPDDKCGNCRDNVRF